MRDHSPIRDWLMEKERWGNQPRRYSSGRPPSDYAEYFVRLLKRWVRRFALGLSLAPHNGAIQGDLRLMLHCPTYKKIDSAHKRICRAIQHHETCKAYRRRVEMPGRVEDGAAYFLRGEIFRVYSREVNERIGLLFTVRALLGREAMIEEIEISLSDAMDSFLERT
jgi:hypothetical protein